MSNLHASQSMPNLFYDEKKYNPRIKKINDEEKTKDKDEIFIKNKLHKLHSVPNIKTIDEEKTKDKDENFIKNKLQKLNSIPNIKTKFNI